MDESLLKTMKRVAALIADVFPFVKLEWDPDEPDGDVYQGMIANRYYIEVAPVLEEEVNGHIIDVFFSQQCESTPISTFQLPGDPDWEKFESWLMERVYREIIMEAGRMLDACGIDFPLPPLSVKHGADSKPAYVRPSGRAQHLIEMSDLFWVGSAIIAGPPGGGKSSVALHIAYAALDEGPVHVLTNEQEPVEFLNSFARRFPQWRDSDKVLSVHSFDTEGKSHDVFDSLVTWIKGLDKPHLVVLDDPILTKKVQDRLPELSRLTTTRILAVAQPAKKVDTPEKWAKKLGDDLDTLGAAFWVEWGERKDLGQIYVMKHHTEQGARLLPVAIKR